MPIYSTYRELLAQLQQSGKALRVLGHCPDGSPLICARSGGEKTPSILIMAGSHSTEQAGVSAAVDLVESLRRVYMTPGQEEWRAWGFLAASTR